MAWDLKTVPYLAGLQVREGRGKVGVGEVVVVWEAELGKYLCVSRKQTSVRVGAWDGR